MDRITRYRNRGALPKETVDIYRDHDVCTPNVYIGDHQGCETVWYDSVPAARKSLKDNKKVLTGKDLVNCNMCSKTHHPTEEDYNLYFNCLCEKLKLAVAKKYNRKVHQ